MSYFVLFSRPPRISARDSVSFRVSEKPPSEFAEIVVSPRMLTDHLANVVCDVLDAIVETIHIDGGGIQGTTSTTPVGDPSP